MRPGCWVGGVAVSLTCGTQAAFAQDRLWDDLQGRIKSEALSLGALFQFVGDVQSERTFPGENGFSVANFRFSLSGRLDGGVDYLLQSNFGGLLDARIGWQLHPYATLDVGRFKTPYSREFLTGAGSIDLVNRSQSVSALAPARGLGAAVRGLAQGLQYSVGLFNGGGGVGGNARGNFLGVARLAWHREGRELALNAAWNGDRRRLAEGSDPTFANLRRLFGADARVVQGPWLVSAEVDMGSGALGSGSDPWGGFFTVGYLVRENSQLLLRLDHFDPGPPGEERTLIIPAWNLWPTSATELQVNAVLPVDGFGGEPQLLVNLQLAF